MLFKNKEEKKMWDIGKNCEMTKNPKNKGNFRCANKPRKHRRWGIYKNTPRI